MNKVDIYKKFVEIFYSENEYIFDYELLDYIEETVIPNKENLPILYRYSPADYYNIRGLERGTIHLSEIGKMNDIFEGLTGEIDDQALNEIDKLYDLAYIKSFSENKNDLKMWSNYADEFAGMCVAYDISKLPNDILYHLYPVRYSNIRKIKNNLHFSFSELEKMKQAIQNGDDYTFDFLKDVMGLFLSKSLEWENEKEWRLIVSYLQMNNKYDEVELSDDSKSERKLYNINSPDVTFKCATTIYLGPKMEEIKREHLKEIGENLKIRVVQMELSKNEYKLEEKEVEKQCQK